MGAAGDSGDEGDDSEEHAAHLHDAVEGDRDAEALLEWQSEDRLAHDEQLVARVEEGRVRAAFRERAPGEEDVHRAMQEVAEDGHADLEAEALLNLAEVQAGDLAESEEGEGSEGSSGEEGDAAAAAANEEEDKFDAWLIEAQAGLLALLDREVALREKPIGFCTVLGRPDLACLRQDTTEDAGARNIEVTLAHWQIIGNRQSAIGLLGFGFGQVCSVCSNLMACCSRSNRLLLTPCPGEFGIEANGVVFVHWQNPATMYGRVVHLFQDRVVYSIEKMHPARRVGVSSVHMQAYRLTVVSPPSCKTCNNNN